MISNIDLGKRLKHFRKKGNITQEEMAKYCQVSKNHISALERGIYTCNAFILITYAQKLNISLDELVGIFTEENKAIPEPQESSSALSIGQQPLDKIPEKSSCPNPMIPGLQDALCSMSKERQQQILDIIFILKRPVDTAED